jgi:hypothetical protein
VFTIAGIRTEGIITRAASASHQYLARAQQSLLPDIILAERVV